MQSVLKKVASTDETVLSEIGTPFRPLPANGTAKTFPTAVSLAA